MTDRPIIFSAPMIRALLDGRKTQTRRIVKINSMLPDFCGGRGDKDDPAAWGWEDSDHGDWVTLEKEPGQRMGWRDWRGAYRIGDRLWVRETCATWEGGHRDVVHRANVSDKDWSDLSHDARSLAPWKIRRSIHMPRWASRLSLTLTDVRVQRLQEISEADAWAEGCKPDPDCADDHGNPFPAEEPHPKCGTVAWDCAREWFADIWGSIHGSDSWDANPWVVAMTFDVRRCNIDQMEFAS